MLDGFLAIAKSKKYTNDITQQILNAGFKVQVEQDRSILNTIGQEKILYLLPKISSNQNDGYDEYIYTNNAWEWVGHTDVDLSAYYTKTEIDNKGYLTEHQDISGKENISNKVTSVSASSTDNEYPSAKCVYDAIESAIASQAIDLSSATVTLSASSFTYDSTSKVPSVTSVVLDGQTLTLGTDYAVVSSPATNAGSYTLTVNGIGSYSGTVTANWTIAKAQATISGADSISVVGIGESQSETYTTTGDGTMSFSISDSSVATISSSGGQVTLTSVAAGSATLTVTVADGTNYLGTTKTVSVAVTEASANTVFGVVWDYSLGSPTLARLTTLTDPLEVVTDCPTTEPTACVGTSGGQSDFDNYMPWSGMVRKNYVNGGVVDFTGYDNGETYVFIPEFWSKIVDDSEHSKMYIYISSEELTGFTKHPGSRRYVGRYKCSGQLKSTPGGLAHTQTMNNFRINLRNVNSNYYLYDIHTYNAIQLLYLVEFADFDIRSKIGAGITTGSSQNSGRTDTLTYHTGRASGTENLSAVQYRWIENLYGNVWEFIDGVIIDNKLVYICSDPSKYGGALTNDYISTGLYLPEGNDFVKKLHGYENCYLFPKEHGGSESTYICAKGGGSASGTASLRMGGSYESGETFGSGLFTSSSDGFTYGAANRGARQMLILGGDS